MSLQRMARHVFAATDLATKTVIVYSDRAEVKRVVKVELSPGRNEVIIQNVSSVIERQSLRVEYRGKGNVQIQEVQFQEYPINEESDENAAIRPLEEQKIELEDQKGSLDDEIAILKRRAEVLDGVAGQIGSSVATAKDPVKQQSLFLFSPEALSNLTQFLEYYGTTAKELRKELREKTRQSEKLYVQIDALERRIDQLRCSSEYDNLKRMISIVLESEVKEETEIFLSYQVYCANWKPTYDIRACNASGDTTERSDKIAVCCYGLIEQKTGEDWCDTEVILSTATPSVAGNVPSLSPITAAFHRPSFFRSRNGSSQRKPNSAMSDEDMGFGSFDYNDCADAAALHRRTIAQANSDMDHSVAVSYEHLPCTCFAIARPHTIVSDGSEHKVMITQVDLEPTYLHETVPSKVASAFLTAAVINTSAITFLPGPANVYLNNSFVAKTHLKSVAPGEEFRCSLGIDPAVKVEVKPAQNFHEQVGFVSRSSLLTHSQTVSLRNAKAHQPVHVTVRESIPRAVDEKIKITVISPDLKPGRTDARLNKDNNLEWTCVLEPGEVKNLHVKWTAEHPIHETVVYKHI
uniref:Protein F37C4.5 n=1 Tax=Steinernema glaseri TaxID=37863 RepID=A0A1I8ABV4_9BILA